MPPACPPPVADRRAVLSEPSPTPPSAASPPPLLVHSHLRWDFVWQRPQQMLARLAARAPVYFVEEPVAVAEARAHLVVTTPTPGVTRILPVLPRGATSSGATSSDHDLHLVAELLCQLFGPDGALAGGARGATQWFYSPMSAPVMLGRLAEHLRTGAVVYDCMDELRNFRYAPPDLGRREQQLLRRADLVLAGGHRLWQARARVHANAHFIGCGVDVAHFAAGREVARPTDLGPVDRPVMGYYGVIDERLDYELIDQLARAHPEATVAMVGPVVKVDPDALPAAENLRWLGARAYAELPAYSAAFAVCLMPFALNAATAYINPTKALEYMAAGRPVVSTAVPDVLHHFRPVARVGHTRTEFVAEAGRALRDPRPDLLAMGRQWAEANTWEAIVARVERLLAAVERAGAQGGRPRAGTRGAERLRLGPDGHAVGRQGARAAQGATGAGVLGPGSGSGPHGSGAPRGALGDAGTGSPAPNGAPNGARDLARDPARGPHPAPELSEAVAA